ncbi:MAG: 2-hydroxyacyl-CoA dehydratase, partial [Pirellulaceae bacterium]|nr:2-hydroxyacyl-CoA dehydratase [Pirellulaceae bacterium]
GSLMTGEQFQFVTGASFADEPSRYTENLRTLVDVLRKAGAAGYQVAGADAPRVLLAGAPLIYPNFKLLEIIEKAGAVIVSDTSCTATQAFYQHLAPRDWSLREMLKALAEKKLLPCMCPCFGSFQDRMLRLRELLRVSKADGIIFHELRTCTLFAAEGEFLRRELEEGGSIPLLIVNTDYASSDKEYLRTRVEAFLEILGQ